MTVSEMVDALTATNGAIPPVLLARFLVASALEQETVCERLVTVRPEVVAQLVAAKQRTYEVEHQEALQAISIDHETVALLEQIDGGKAADEGKEPRTGSARFFDRNGLRHASLRNEVLSMGPIAVGPGQSLWHYRDGCWLPHGEAIVRLRVRWLLFQRMRKMHADGIVADLKNDEAFITDAQPTQWINFRNGLLDWATGDLIEHSPKVPSTYQLAVEWNPEAICPRVDAWLGQVAPADTTELLWEVLGALIYADVPFHRAILLLGAGRNGKGTYLRLAEALVGHEHCSHVTLQQLGEDRFAAADLFGKVANIAGDLDARSVHRTDLFKMATGGDRIRGEHKYGNSFYFYNRATMLFSANEAPGSDDRSHGFFSRWIIIPFNQLHLAPGQEDPSIEKRLQAELSGVAVKAVQGLRRSMNQRGFSISEAVKAASADYRESADPMRSFVTECIEVTDRYEHTEARASVFARYKEWCEYYNYRTMGAGRFWKHLVAVDSRIDPSRISMGERRVGGVQLRGAWK